MKPILPTDFPEFRFDELSALASKDPDAFEALRASLISNAIQSSGSNSELLAQLQRRLEEEGDAGIPRYQSCLRLSGWLDDSYRQIGKVCV